MKKICRILDLIGSTSCLVLLIYLLGEEGVPNGAFKWWVVVSLTLVAFHLYTVPLNEDSDSLVGLWIEEKKDKLRKRIDERH